MDLDTKARVYGSAGFPTYWVVHQRGVDVFSEPSSWGYRQRRTFRPGQVVPVPYRPSVTVAVDAILAAPDE